MSNPSPTGAHLPDERLKEILERINPPDFAQLLEARDSVALGGLFARAVIDVADLLVEIQRLRALLIAREAEIETFERDAATMHAILSDFDSVTNPEEYPDLHDRTFAAIGECRNRFCKSAASPDPEPHG